MKSGGIALFPLLLGSACSGSDPEPGSTVLVDEAAEPTRSPSDVPSGTEKESPDELPTVAEPAASEEPEPAPAPRRPRRDRENMPAFRRSPTIQVSTTDEARAFWGKLVVGDAQRRRPPRQADASEPDLSAEERELLAELQAIGYASGTVEADDLGPQPVKGGAGRGGYNVYVDGSLAGAVLIDMEGNELHRWSRDFWEIWPEAPRGLGVLEGSKRWRRVHLFENGDVLGIFSGIGIAKLDAASNLLWARACAAHHDLEVNPDGSIWVLGRDIHVLPRIHPKKPTIEDILVRLAPDGRELEHISVLECMERSRFRYLWDEALGRTGDVFHTNSIQVLDGRHADRVPAFRAGNILLSSRPLDAIFVVDPRAEEVVWAHTGEFKEQHDPQLLPNGNILLFDNKGAGQSRSRVLEIDPLDGRVVWRFGGVTARLWTSICGLAERLDSGNTLVIESNRGRALEVSPDGKVVWEFVTPNRVGVNTKLIATLFELVRLPADFPVHWATGVPGRGR